MNKPLGLKQAEIAIWASLAVAAVVALIDKWIGAITSGEFVITLILYGLLCIIPYKIGRGSNAARYIFSIITVISLLFLVGGEMESLPHLDWIVGLLMIPVDIFILYRLFESETSEWFSRKST
jgi:hypothetical protein